MGIALGRQTVVVALAAWLLVSCGGAQTTPAELEALKQETQLLRIQVQGLHDGLEALKQQLHVLKDRVVQAETSNVIANLSGPQEAALFDPQEDKGYTAVRAPAGSVLVVLEKLEPYLDGFTVTIRLGNPSSVTYSGVSGKVKWGRKYDALKGDEWNKLAEKEITLSDTVHPGAWSVVKFNVAPASPEQVRRIVFAPKFDKIRMRSVGGAG